MDKDTLKGLSPDSLKQLLAGNDITFRDISSSLNISAAAVSDIINHKYKGADNTVEKVYSKIAKMLEGREELSDDIYDNINTVDKLLHVGINSAKFTIPEKEFLISLHKKLKPYKEAQHA